MATIRVQAVDASNDPIVGANGDVFLSDLDAVTQIIGTRLKLLQDEWWEDLNIGFPLLGTVLNHSASPNNQAASLMAIQSTILNSPYVTGIIDFSYSYNTATFSVSFIALVGTTFGTLIVQNVPGKVGN